MAHIHTPYPTKFGVVRQPYAADRVPGTLVFDSVENVGGEVREAAPGSLLWLVWSFSLNDDDRQWGLTVRPPRLGGSRRVGVFATRSSFRPNSLAISAVKVTSEGRLLEGGGYAVDVSGADMVDGTPVFAVFSYRPSCDLHPDASLGWVGCEPWAPLEVAPIAPSLIASVPEDLREGLYQVLSQDPRPAYAREGQDGRVFWTAYADTAVSFKVAKETLHVVTIEPLDADDLDELHRTGTLARLRERHHAH